MADARWEDVLLRELVGADPRRLAGCGRGLWHAVMRRDGL